MEDIEIINQLLNGLHLSKEEVKRAVSIMFMLDVELKGRLK